MGSGRLLATVAAASPALGFEVERGAGHAAVRWDSPRVVVYAIETGTLPGGEEGVAADAVRAAFAAWDDLGPEIDFAEDEPSDARDADAAAGDGHNSVLRPTRWDRAPEVLAETRVRYGAGDVIEEADILLNPGVRWTVMGGGSDAGAQDVQNTVTHEIGHLLGLAHSDVAEATMFATTPSGETRKRDLHDDDVDGYRFVYAAFDGEGDGGAWGDGCSAAPGRRGAGAAWLAAVALVAALRRRRP